MKRYNSNQNIGFTLTDILLVLIVAGLSAVVVVPHYYDMRVAAADKVLAGALATGVSQARLTYMRMLLSGSPAPVAEAVRHLNAECARLGDFNYSYAVDETGNGIRVMLEACPGNNAWDNKSDTAKTEVVVLF